MLNPDNDDARAAFGLSEERWADYTPYDRALVDLEYKVNQSEGGHVEGETGPTKEAAISLDPGAVLKEGYASDLVSQRGESPLEVAREEGTGILKRLVEADDVRIEFSEVKSGEIRAFVSPAQYSDA